MSFPQIQQTRRRDCLVILTLSIEGVNAKAFVQTYCQLNTAFNIQLCSATGKSPEFVKHTEETHKWLAEFKTKPQCNFISFKKISDLDKYDAIVIPDGYGAHFDLLNDDDLGQIITKFLFNNKVICGIGSGVSALFSAKNSTNKNWLFKGYNMTCVSVEELMETSIYLDTRLNFPINYILDNGGNCSFTSVTKKEDQTSSFEEFHVVIDKKLITAQNAQSTTLAINNVIFLSNI